MGKHAFCSVCAKTLTPLGTEDCFVLATAASPSCWAPWPWSSPSSTKWPRPTLSTCSEILSAMSPLALVPPLARAARLPVLAQRRLELLPLRPLLTLAVCKEAGTSILAASRLSPRLANGGLVGGPHPARSTRPTLWSNHRRPHSIPRIVSSSAHPPHGQTDMT